MTGMQGRLLAQPQHMAIQGGVAYPAQTGVAYVNPAQTGGVPAGLPGMSPTGTYGRGKYIE